MHNQVWSRVGGRRRAYGTAAFPTGIAGARPADASINASMIRLPGPGPRNCAGWLVLWSMQRRDENHEDWVGLCCGLSNGKRDWSGSMGVIKGKHRVCRYAGVCGCRHQA